MENIMNWWQLPELSKWDDPKSSQNLPKKLGIEYFCSVESPHIASYFIPVIGVQLQWSDMEGKGSTAEWAIFWGKESSCPFENEGCAFSQFYDHFGDVQWGVSFEHIENFAKSRMALHKKLFVKGRVNRNGFLIRHS
jgi:hypothetical protein